MSQTTETRTDPRGNDWAQVLDFEWTRNTATRTATIQSSLGGYFLTITTGQHGSAIGAIGNGSPALVAEQFDTFDAAAFMAAIVIK